MFLLMMILFILLLLVSLSLSPSMRFRLGFTKSSSNNYENYLKHEQRKQILMNNGVLDKLSSVTDLQDRQISKIINETLLKDNVFANDDAKYTQFRTKLFEFQSGIIRKADFLNTMEHLLAGHTDLLFRFKTFAIKFDEQASKRIEWFRKIERRFGRNSDIYKSVIDLKHVIGFTEFYERLWLLLEGHEDLFFEYVDFCVQLNSIHL